MVSEELQTVVEANELSATLLLGVMIRGRRYF